ncbi:MAG TPA: 23S rRNA (guanosine(2251)-2'-O)-methyltransferase RlmB [Thermoleophilaceae bacterium]|nr:23S rRNA (guanosine(2251)-2'-O)-methyltransferase RlmB [Thermoleophilaceae bacterium]
MIVYGRNPVREALRGRRGVSRVWASERMAGEPWLSEAAPARADDAELASLCGSPDHQGVCADVAEFEYADARALLAGDDSLVVCLDEVTDPQNLGAICRVAEGAGAAGVVVGERRSAHVTPAVCKASAGAVEHLPVARVRNLADFLREAKEEGAWVYGASTAPDAVPYDEPDYRGRVVLVLGSEGRGLRPRVAAGCDQLIALPMRGRVESLNVSAAAAALVYGILHFVRPGLTGFHKPGKLARTDKA